MQVMTPEGVVMDSCIGILYIYIKETETTSETSESCTK